MTEPGTENEQTGQPLGGDTPPAGRGQSEPSRARRVWQRVQKVWSPDPVSSDFEAELAELRAKVPSPVFWLFGKTQSGKTSVVKYLTGAEDAAIGSGFRPCTKTSREYPFPTAEVPVLTFLDTRGVDEPGYDPAEDLVAFDDRAHLVIVTSRLTDFAHGNVRAAVAKIRAAKPTRPVVLALTCWHEVRPQDQHPQPYPFDPLTGPLGQPPAPVGPVADDIVRLVAEQTTQFAGLVDRVVPIDFTKPTEGYNDATFGGDALKRVLLELLPSAYQTTFARLDAARAAFQDLHLKHAMPVIFGYSSLAATAGGFPIPFVDLLVLPAIQTRMVNALGALYGQPLTATKFLESAATVGIGLIARQAIRELVKFVPGLGAAAGAAMAGASTYALGRAYCAYYQEVHAGRVPNMHELKKLYQEQLATAESAWFAKPGR